MRDLARRVSSLYVEQRADWGILLSGTSPEARPVVAPLPRPLQPWAGGRMTCSGDRCENSGGRLDAAIAQWRGSREGAGGGPTLVRRSDGGGRAAPALARVEGLAPLRRRGAHRQGAARRIGLTSKASHQGGLGFAMSRTRGRLGTSSARNRGKLRRYTSVGPGRTAVKLPQGSFRR
jgi:hypothetical protein